MRRVLIVTSAYSPSMTADMHRARHLAWELPSLGWQVEILCPDASYQAPHSRDADSSGFFAPGILVHEVPARFSWLARILGLGGIGWRAALPMYLAGRRLLRSKHYDLVYFSTTQGPLFALGPLWRHYGGVPFILDIQDPLYKEGSATPVWSKPSPKHTIVHKLAKRIESFAVPRAAALVAVSAAYIEALLERYERRNPDWKDSRRQAVIPFPVSLRDLKEAARGEPSSRAIAYVGAGGPIMARSFGLLCQCLAQLRIAEPALIQGVRIDLRGTMTGWQPGDPKHLHDIAVTHGVGDLVDEDPRRVSFRESIELLQGGDGALVLGIDNAGYMPSKLFGYAGSGKPLLAVVRHESPPFRQLEADPTLGHVIGFDEKGQPTPNAMSEVAAFLREVKDRRKFEREAALREFDTATMAARHAALFEACL